MARKREFDKEAVIEKAMLIFWEQGFEATSIHDLKKAMNISTSSMYETFGDKRGIFLEALSRYCQLEVMQLTQTAQKTASAFKLVEEIFDSVEIIARNSEENYGSLVFNAMVEFGTKDAGVTELIFKHYFQIAEIIAEVFNNGQTSGTVTKHYDASQLAHLILCVVHGVVTVKRAQPDYAYQEPIKQIILELLSH